MAEHVTTLPNLPLGPVHLDAIVGAIRAAKGSQPSRAEAERVTAWIEQVCINAGFVDSILSGHMGVRYPKGGEPQLSLTTKGIAHVEGMLLESSQ